jgi:hypothetical protein
LAEILLRWTRGRISTQIPGQGTGEIAACETFTYDFIFHGQRYKGSTECTTKTRAKAYEKDLRDRLERAWSGLPTEKPEMRVRSVNLALDEYQKHYTVGHALKSMALVKERGAHLRRLLCNEIAAAFNRLAQART